MTANTERGEVDIVLDGKTYTMRPSYEAQVAIEQKAGPLVTLIVKYRENGLSLKDMEAIVSEGIRAYAKESGDKMLQGISDEKVGRLIFEGGGVQPHLASVLEFLTNCFFGGKAAPKKTVETT